MLGNENGPSVLSRLRPVVIIASRWRCHAVDVSMKRCRIARLLIRRRPASLTRPCRFDPSSDDRPRHCTGGRPPNRTPAETARDACGRAAPSARRDGTSRRQQQRLIGVGERDPAATNCWKWRTSPRRCGQRRRTDPGEHADARANRGAVPLPRGRQARGHQRSEVGPIVGADSRVDGELFPLDDLNSVRKARR
jgi:hypothetical protein